MRRLLWLLLPSVSLAATLNCQPPNQTIGTMTADATATANVIQADGSSSLLLYADNSSVAGTNTGIICQQSGDGTNWIAVPNAYPSQIYTVTGGKGPICVVTKPVGLYRVTNTTCNTNCSIVVKAKCVRED